MLWWTEGSCTHQQVDVGSHQEDLVIHGLLAVVVAGDEGEGSEADGRTHMDALPHACVKVRLVHTLAKRVKQAINPGVVGWWK